MKKQRPYDEPRLLRLLAQGDVPAFREIYDRHSPYIYRLAYAFLRSSEKAEDFVQELFIAVWMNRAGYTRVENMRAYLVGMSKYRLLKAVQKSGRQREAEKLWSDITPQQENSTELTLNRQELEAVFQQAVSQLPPQQQKVFRLAKIEGLTYEAIGEQLKISTETVKQHMVKANHFIRARLQPHHLPLTIGIMLFLGGR